MFSSSISCSLWVVLQFSIMYVFIYTLHPKSSIRLGVWHRPSVEIWNILEFIILFLSFSPLPIPCFVWNIPRWSALLPCFLFLTRTFLLLQLFPKRLTVSVRGVKRINQCFPWGNPNLVLTIQGRQAGRWRSNLTDSFLPLITYLVPSQSCRSGKSQETWS